MTDEVPHYLAAHIQEQIAARTHELGIRVDVRGDVVYLRGDVISPERRTLIGEAALIAAAGREVRNEVSVVPVRAPEGEERLL